MGCAHFANWKRSQQSNRFLFYFYSQHTNTHQVAAAWASCVCIGEEASLIKCDQIRNGTIVDSIYSFKNPKKDVVAWASKTHTESFHFFSIKFQLRTTKSEYACDDASFGFYRAAPSTILKCVNSTSEIESSAIHYAVSAKFLLSANG